MPYCIHCGVKVNDRHIECPLCTKKLEFPNFRKSLPPLYPNEVNKIALIKSRSNKKVILTSNFIGLLTLLIIMLNVGIDYTLNSTLTWSKVSSISLLLFFEISLQFLYLNRNPYIFYSFTNISVGVYLFILDLITINKWFIRFALPSLLSLQIVSFIIFIIFKRVKRKLLRATILLLITNIYLIIVNVITSGGINWALICTSILLPTSIFLLIISLMVQKSYY